MINPTPIYYKQNNKANNVGSILIVIITIITLIISFLTSIISIVVAFKLNLLTNIAPIQFNNHLTTINKNFLVSNQVFLNEKRIKINESFDGNLSFETPNTYLKLNSSQIEFYAKDQLEFRFLSDKKLFPPDFSKIPLKPSHLTIKNGLHQLNKIRSPTDQNLEIIANNQLNLRGNNGLKLDGKFINLKSDQYITINSLNSTINLDSLNGDIYFQFDNLIKNQIKLTTKDSLLQNQEKEIYQHKLCICGNTGLIFKLSVTDKLNKCTDVRFPVSDNPCIINK